MHSIARQKRRKSLVFHGGAVYETGWRIVYTVVNMFTMLAWRNNHSGAGRRLSLARRRTSTFLPRDVMYSVSSVCHMPVLCRNGWTYGQTFSPSGSHTILVFPCQTLWQYSDGIPDGGVEFRGYSKVAFSTNISLYLGNNTRYGHSYHGMRIGNRTQSFQWYDF